VMLDNKSVLTIMSFEPPMTFSWVYQNKNT
jgi:hypothetical protein